jgi:hypothetical protein
MSFTPGRASRSCARLHDALVAHECAAAFDEDRAFVVAQALAEPDLGWGEIELRLSVAKSS